MGNVTKSGFNELTATLENIAERSSRGGREELLKGAESIKELAKVYAPRDLMNLENSIKRGELSGLFGRKAYTAYVDESMSAGGKKKVGDYADIIHELYHNFQPGEETLKKMRDNPGVHIGGKYLERALDDLKPSIEENVKRRIKEGIGH